MKNVAVSKGGNFSLPFLLRAGRDFSRPNNGASCVSAVARDPKAYGVTRRRVSHTTVARPLLISLLREEVSPIRLLSLSFYLPQLGRGRESPRLSPRFFFFRLPTSCFLCFRCCGGPFPSRDAGCRHLLQKLRVNPIISRPGPRASAPFRRATNAPLRVVPGRVPLSSRRHVPRPFFKLLTTRSRENLTSRRAFARRRRNLSNAAPRAVAKDESYLFLFSSFPQSFFPSFPSN